MILMISSNGKQNNVFSVSVLLPIAILSGVQVTTIGLPILHFTSADIIFTNF